MRAGTHFLSRKCRYTLKRMISATMTAPGMAPTRVKLPMANLLRRKTSLNQTLFDPLNDTACNYITCHDHQKWANLNTFDVKNRNTCISRYFRWIHPQKNKYSKIKQCVRGSNSIVNEFNWLIPKRKLFHNSLHFITIIIEKQK